MTGQDPALYKRTTQQVIEGVEADLRQRLPRWQGKEEDALWALLQIFGRMPDAIIARLNQVPGQHFLAFLNEAEIENLPPRAAEAELTFLPAKDAMPVIRVPAGTQATTRKTESQPEIIFETNKAFITTPTDLVSCIAVDRLNFGDRTAVATGQQVGSFAPFAGDIERERFLFLGDDELFTFDDVASRTLSAVTLNFTFDRPGNPGHDGWGLEWLYWNGTDWTDLLGAGGSVLDQTGNFAGDGDVVIASLPEMAAGEDAGRTGLWLLGKLTGGHSREYLPAVRQVLASRRIDASSPQKIVVDAALAATQSGTIVTELEPGGSFYPLGLSPQPLDTFYLRADEAFTKPGAAVTITFDLKGPPETVEDAGQLNKLRIEWSYSSPDGWIDLGASTRGCPSLIQRRFEDYPAWKPQLVERSQRGAEYLRFAVPPQDVGGPWPPPFADGQILFDDVQNQYSVNIAVPKDCASLADEVLLGGGAIGDRLEFKDNTQALTKAGTVRFRVPPAGGVDPPFARTKVADQEGCWLRAQLVDGGYSVREETQVGATARPKPGLMERLRLAIGKALLQEPWIPPTSYAPVVQLMQVDYDDYRSDIEPRPIARCLSRIDGRWHDHAADRIGGRPFEPFSTGEAAPALYLGFNPLDPTQNPAAFPAGQWIQLLLDIEEQATGLATGRRLVWEYWDGKAWTGLECSDGSRGLSQRGYLGFLAPPDHRTKDEFGILAHWVRIRPLAPAAPPAENLRPGGSPDRASTGGEAQTTGRVKAIRLNTVPISSADTVANEVLGSSSGEPGQRFCLARSPVLPGVQIEVREPGINPSQPAEQPAAAAGDHSQWVPWQQVRSFHTHGPDSRCFVLEPSTGTIYLGDGQRGKIPPPGIGNVRAKSYHALDAGIGNVTAGTIAVLRNPIGDLNDVRTVTNPEPAAGGRPAETQQDVKLSGPRRLKHRSRAVTLEDFQWLAMEVGGVAQATCLPTRNRQGQVEPGWVTMVILPQSEDPRPVPTPSLMRQVREYLERQVLTNLKAGELAQQVSHVVMQGPKYIQVAVQASVVPFIPEEADPVRLAVVRELQTFLHPLRGGPQHQGWPAGRDVYVSEIYAEIEAVPGVDHVVAASIQGSALQQRCLTLAPGQASLRFTVPAGGQVSTFDERLKLILADSMLAGSPLDKLVAYGLALDDEVMIIAADNTVLAGGLRIAELGEDGRQVVFVHAFDWPPTLTTAPGALLSLDGRVRLPIDRCLPAEQWQPGAVGKGLRRLTGVILRDFSPGDRVSLVPADRHRRQDHLLVAAVTSTASLEHMFIPDDHLVCSGTHQVEIVLDTQVSGAVAGLRTVPVRDTTIG